MNTENLTDKQKYNRSYYAKNAEKIRAQKRAYYQSKKANKIKNDKSTARKQIAVRVNAEAGREAKRKVEVRRRIEDLLIEKKLLEEEY